MEGVSGGRVDGGGVINYIDNGDIGEIFDEENSHESSEKFEASIQIPVNTSVEALENEYNKLVEMQKLSWETVRQKMMQLDKRQEETKRALIDAGKKLDLLEKKYRGMIQQESKDKKLVTEIGEVVPMIKGEVTEIKEIVDACSNSSLGGADIVMKRIVDDVVQNVEKQLNEDFSRKLEDAKVSIAKYDESFAEERTKRLKEATEPIHRAIEEIINKTISEYGGKVRDIVEQYSRNLIRKLSKVEGIMHNVTNENSDVDDNENSAKTTLIYTPSKEQLKEMDETLDPIEEKITIILSSNDTLKKYTEGVAEMYKVEEGYKAAELAIKEYKKKFINSNTAKVALDALKAVTERAVASTEMLLNETENQILSIEALNKSMRNSCPNGDLQGYVEKTTIAQGKAEREDILGKPPSSNTQIVIEHDAEESM